MKKLIATCMLLSSLVSSISMANVKSADIIRCNSQCWQDMGDLSESGQCFKFYITQESETQFSARMDGGWDDAGNQNTYKLGPVKKSYGSSGNVIWELQKNDGIKSIEFSREKWSPEGGTCTIKTTSKVFDGETNW
jgi:hypothetical protein